MNQIRVLGFRPPYKNQSVSTCTTLGDTLKTQKKYGQVAVKLFTLTYFFSVRRFVIYTGFLFSERVVFDSVVRVYLDNLIWPGHSYSTFEVSNVSEMLSIVIFLILTLFFVH